jgi:hypothetical protein
MKNTSLLLLFLVGSVIFAQDAEITYVDYPEVEIRRDGGATILADFGDILNAGDSVITTRFGAAELELASGGTVTVAEDTVYVISEVEGSDGPQTVMSVVLGRVGFRFARMVGGREPAIGTPTSVAGVRGTAFTTYVAVDGSTVFIVDEGEVAVTSSGSTVTLVANEGVEVLPGEAPGEKFDAIERAFDFQEFSQSRFDALIEDPVRAIEGLAGTMDQFIEQLEIIVPQYEAAQAALDEAQERREELAETATADEQETYYLDTFVPLRNQRQILFKNMRFYARSALSLRRYLLGRLSVVLMLEDIAGRTPAGYEAYRSIYSGLLDRYESVVVPILDPTDI